MQKRLCYIFAVITFLACNSDPEPMNQLPELSVGDSRAFEQAGTGMMQFEFIATGTVDEPISITYSVKGKTAEPGKDFIAVDGSATIEAGQQTARISVDILDDEINEVDEKLILKIMDVSKAIITDSIGIGVIQDNDDPITFEADGYVTSPSHYGYSLIWAEEFDGTELDTSIFNHDLGNGCPNLCGWGNNELEWYTDEEENIFFSNGKLILQTTEGGQTGFKSAKIHTKGKKEFRYGRIDIRARLPFGQGIWPAIWMLGANIDEVGWPACGEIDIMEMVGHQAQTVHGTAHWGPQGRAYSTYKGSSFTLPENFSEKFHVFSLAWERNELVWYVDETRFHTIEPIDMQGETYRFNQAFYLIINLAVGGNWPGSPNETTVFPQQLEIDYIRVFQ